MPPDLMALQNLADLYRQLRLRIRLAEPRHIDASAGRQIGIAVAVTESGIFNTLIFSNILFTHTMTEVCRRCSSSAERHMWIAFLWSADNSASNAFPKEASMGMMTQYRECERGTSAVEFALISPVFIAVLVTLVGYGIYLSAANSVQQIAADAARTAVAGVTETDREQLVNTYITTSTINEAFITPSKFTATVAADPTDVNQFTVSLVYDASNLPIWNLYGFMMPSSTITRSATIRMGNI